MGLFNFIKNRKKKKGGWVYTAESTRADGSKKIYTGMTRRKPYTRWGEHIKSVKSNKSKSWVGKGKWIRPLGAVWSSNPEKAERTIKRMSSKGKRVIGAIGARRYKKRRRRW
ncbi:hypothetical protein KY361_06590 [Candidatus Woesearchaeota archaeon]|nr:hypothetical protein [Candidatus Woesearchaeota archaeon]